MSDPIIRVWRGNIVTLDVDVIVNQANSALAGGGSTDGAIHRGAGFRLMKACRLLAPCPPGEARLTPGFDLTARWVAHAVGPIWRGGGNGEHDLLGNVYRACLDLAASVDARTIAFPAVSTGVYSFPKREAALIAVASIRKWLSDRPHLLSEVILAAFSAEDRDALDRAFR